MHNLTGKRGKQLNNWNLWQYEVNLRYEVPVTYQLKTKLAPMIHESPKPVRLFLPAKGAAMMAP